MTPEWVGLLAIVALLVLIILRCPIALAMILVGFTGFAVIVGLGPALAVLENAPFEVASTYSFTMIPLFILMGSFAARAGLSADLFTAARSLLRGWNGGLALAAVTACGGFSAVSGSSLATAATMTRVALPEMQAQGYSPRLAAGSLAAGGTLGIMIPPSIALLLYALMTEQSVATLFIAGIVPGVLAYSLYVLTIMILVWWRPELGGQRSTDDTPCAQVLLRAVPVLVLFLLVMGGLYSGVFTPTEAAGAGACLALLFALVRGMGWSEFKAALHETLRISAAIFLILIGAEVFGYLLSVSQITWQLVDAVRAMGLEPWQVLVLILLFFVLFGCIMDSLAMILLTVPLLYPLIIDSGFDPIWFGIIAVVTVELGLITPPVGMNLFVIRSVAPELPLKTIFLGTLPFVLADLVRLALLVAMPALVLWLPTRLGMI